MRNEKLPHCTSAWSRDGELQEGEQIHIIQPKTDVRDFAQSEWAAKPYALYIDDVSQATFYRPDFWR